MGLKNEVLRRLAHVKKLGSDPVLRAEIQKLPKHELHVHLGGSIRRNTILDLAQKNGVPLPFDRNQLLKAATPMVVFQGDAIWELFHATYKWYWSCIRTCEDLQRIVVEFLEDSVAQGVVHSEFTVSGSYLLKTFPLNEWTDAIAAGIHEVRKHSSIEAAAILDVSRSSGGDHATQIVNELVNLRPQAICGIGMGGDEARFPSHPFKAAFALARENHIATTVHVSEFVPGDATLTAIEALIPHRLGHALTTIHCNPAYHMLKRSGIHVESCPACNYIGGVGNLTRLSAHPVRRYYDDGIPISINTDDPQILGCDLIDTYACLIKELGFTLGELKATNDYAAKAVFV